MNVVMKRFKAFSFFDSLYHSVILTFSQTSLCTSVQHTQTHTHTSVTDVWQVLICISRTHFPRELIKIRERQALNIAAFV